MPEDQGEPEIPATVVETADVIPEAEPVSTPPEPAPEQPTVTPPPPAAEPAAGPKVASVSDYERRLAEVTSGAPVEEPKPGTPATEPEPAPAATAPPAEPPVESAPPVEPQKPAEFRPRLNSLPVEEREAISLRKDLKEKGQDVPLAECLARVKAKYAGPPAAAAPDLAATPARTAEAVQAEIADTENARREAIRALDPDAQFEAEDKIRALQGEAQELQARQQQEQVSQQSAFEAAVSESHALTARIYPAYAMANHAIHAEADRIYSALEKTGNPLVTQSDCPFRVYQMAANELGIPPFDPGTQPPAAPPTAPKSPALATPKPQPVQRTAVVRPPTAVAPAPASARTTPPGPPKPAFGKIRTTADYEAAVAQFVG